MTEDKIATLLLSPASRASEREVVNFARLRLTWAGFTPEDRYRILQKVRQQYQARNLRSGSGIDPASRGDRSPTSHGSERGGPGSPRTRAGRGTGECKATPRESASGELPMTSVANLLQSITGSRSFRRGDTVRRFHLLLPLLLLSPRPQRKKSGNGSEGQAGKGAA